ncbi:Protein of unknown function [Fontibacillus panacisegetis]|uniref:DUF3221 domain-containing protein n=1 Tax=Fontibacillus panacisegetis TaxID=670482 RepID=A0A1G7LDH0_9BACL|nr:DUF3221 domain-containing protein [Fontibacillus panacisegetis]SDF47577.1 Protein of unknown function [Fontibacillus panacisegetis]
MKKNFFTLLFAANLIGCNVNDKFFINNSTIEQTQQVGEEMDIQGIVIEKNSTSIIIATDLTEEEVKDKTTREIISQYQTKVFEVNTGEITENPKIGDCVNVWTNGKYEESRIIRTAATRIEIVK